MHRARDLVWEHLICLCISVHARVGDVERQCMLPRAMQLILPEHMRETLFGHSNFGNSVAYIQLLYFYMNSIQKLCVFTQINVFITRSILTQYHHAVLVN